MRMLCARIMFLTVLLVNVSLFLGPADAADRPNILLAISDDQSFYHTSKAGYPAIQTPAFDRIAKKVSTSPTRSRRRLGAALRERPC